MPMPAQSKSWYLRPLSRESVFRAVPLSRFWVLLAAGFILFSGAGYYTDLLANGTRPYALVYLDAVYSGLDACLWIIAASRFPTWVLAPIAVLQLFSNRILDTIAGWISAHFVLQAVLPVVGIRFAATSMFWASILSYSLFIRYIVREGKRSIRVQNELRLAHNIQKTLVPPIHLRTPRFEIYGISHPSETVGGDLVDALLLPNGDIVAYLADIAGHGLGASILMGRLKTATRTALIDAAEGNSERTLPLLLDRLNTILPQVKEPNLYATFSGFRLNTDGSVFCAMAASPPLLQWHATTQTISQKQEPQLPIGLLPIANFEGFTLPIAPGDLLIIATDGILECANKQEEEFGVERLGHVLAADPEAPLPRVTDEILAAARAFGPQFDDQTMLLIRCLCPPLEPESSLPRE